MEVMVVEKGPFCWAVHDKTDGQRSIVSLLAVYSIEDIGGKLQELP